MPFLLSPLVFTRKRLDDVFKTLHKFNLEGDICDKETTKRSLGASSDVYCASSKRHGKLVAVKCIRVFLLEDESCARVYYQLSMRLPEAIPI